jgi:hypothetical protein
MVVQRKMALDTACTKRHSTSPFSRIYRSLSQQRTHLVPASARAVSPALPSPQALWLSEELPARVLTLIAQFRPLAFGLWPLAFGLWPLAGLVCARQGVRAFTVHTGRVPQNHTKRTKVDFRLSPCRREAQEFVSSLRVWLSVKRSGDTKSAALSDPVAGPSASSLPSMGAC